MGRNIYLLRHAAVIKPKEKTFIGSTELMLSSTGIFQAKRLAEYFSKLPIQGIYCSSLIRAVNTAEVIAKQCNLPYTTVKELDEISLGEWEGKSFREIKEVCPLEFFKRGMDIFNYTTPGGESFCQLQERAYGAFQKILDSTIGDILIVAHSGTNKAILAKILGVEFQDCFNMKLKYGNINMIKKYEDSYSISKSLLVR